MDYREKTEPEIKLAEVIWKLLEQWKMVLIVAIIFAVACCGVMHVRDMKAYEESVRQAAAMEEQEEMAQADHDNPFVDNENDEMIRKSLLGLEADKRADVEHLIQMKESYQDMQDYLAHSILMNIDPSFRHTFRMEYTIVLPEEDSQYIRSLSNAYIRSLNQSIMSMMGEKLGEDIEAPYIQELVDIAAETEMTNLEMSGRVAIELTVPDDMDMNQLQSDIEQVVKEQNAAFSKSICPHTLQLYWSSDKTAVDYALIIRQMDIYSRYTSLKNNITTFENALSSEQKGVYEAIQAQLAETELLEDSLTEEPAGVLTAPGYSKKWAAVGFVLGIIVYAVLYVLYLYLRPRLRSREEIQDCWRQRVIGEVYLYSKKGLRRFAESKVVFNLHHRGKTDVDRQVAAWADSIISMCSHRGLDQVTFLPVATSDCVQNHRAWNQVWEKLSANLSENGLLASEKCIFDQAGTVDEKSLLEIKNVVPVVFNDVTSYEMMNDVVADARAYDVNILGAVMIGA